jgi:hypothetical protein
MKMKRIMRRFVINEISGVDRPAQAHARAAIMKRADDELNGGDEWNVGRSRSGFETRIDTAATRAKLNLLYEDHRRSHPLLPDDHHRGLAWRDLADDEREAILEEDVGSSEPASKAEDVDLAALAEFALRCTAETIHKADPTLTRERAYVAARAAKPWLLKVQYDARLRQLAAGSGDEVRAAALAKRDAAFDVLQKHAEELRKSNPKLTIEMARVEARRLYPALAGRERAAAMEARSA